VTFLFIQFLSFKIEQIIGKIVKINKYHMSKIMIAKNKFFKIPFSKSLFKNLFSVQDVFKI